MARTAWLVNSRAFAMKVMNTAESIKKENWKSDASIACPNCNYKIENSNVTQEWPGLPAGVKFEPTDEELLGHLSAKLGTGNAQPHPFIDEFILTLEEENGICYTHPGNLPGIKQDGSSVHIFHKTANAYTTGPRKCRKIQSRENVRWHKTGVTKPVYENGKQKGCKKIMVLYATSVKGSKPEKTKWVMHQYHLGIDEDENEGEFVVSKIFYQQEKPCHKNDTAITQENVGRSNGKGDPVTPNPVTPKTSTPPLRSWNQHTYLDGVKEEYLHCPLSPQGADLDATIHQRSKGSEAESNRQNDLPNETTGLTWSAGESQLIEDSQEPINHSLACNEILENRSCEVNIEEGNCMLPNLTECHRVKRNKLERELHQVAPPELENIDLDTPPDVLITDSQISSQESIWHLSWLNKGMDWGSSLSGKNLGDSQ